MIGRAISSRTSGGTGAGPGVNKYFFICGIFDFQRARRTRDSPERIIENTKKRLVPADADRQTPIRPGFTGSPSSPLGITEPMGRVKLTRASRPFQRDIVMASRQLLKVITLRCR